MKNLLLLMLAAVLISATSCRRHDVRRAWVNVPDMKNQACADRIKDMLRHVPGIVERVIKIDLKKKTLLLPGMKNQASADRVKRALKTVPGIDVKLIEISLLDKSVVVPDMNDQDCADSIRDVLNEIPGIQEQLIEFDLQEKTVLVFYQSTSLSMKNIEFYIAEAGFTANEVPADKVAQAALPAECR